MARRRHDIDWLRAGAVLVVFIYHTTRFFNLGDWHVKNDTTYAWVEIWNVFATRWMMPLFFVLSGAGVYYTMNTVRRFPPFVKAKALRLLVPVIVGAFTHAIVQVYLERVSHGRFSGSLIEFLPHYFDGVYLIVGGRGNFAFHGMHLWYLLFLFVYVLLLYPLFRWLGGRGWAVTNAAARLKAAPGAMYVLLPAPLLLMEAFIPASVLRVGNGGWGFVYYIWFLVAGFIIYSSEVLQEVIRRQRRVSLALGGALSLLYFVVTRSGMGDAVGATMRLWLFGGYSIFGGWALLLALLGYAMRYLRRENVVLRYAREAGIAVYILHQTVLLCVGYVVVEWDMPDIMKWAIMTIVSFSAVMVTYEFAVRRYNVVRMLFGMAPRSPNRPMSTCRQATEELLGGRTQ